MKLHPGEFFRLIEESVVEGKRLGRHFHFDPRDLEHKALALMNSLVQVPTRDVMHIRTMPALDQGDLGSCTGNALVGALMTQPFSKPTASYNERTAVALYSLATHIDPSDGVYPPNDVGSTGPDVCKAGMKDGYMRGYMHAYGVDEALTVLQHYPVIIGVNWYDSFDSPDSEGVVTISSNASVRGGHEFEVAGIDVENKRVWAWNSWGPTWADKGMFAFSWDDLDRLLSEQGDCTLPVL